jgi:hypothetical protein
MFKAPLKFCRQHSPKLRHGHAGAVLLDQPGDAQNATGGNCSTRLQDGAAA